MVKRMATLAELVVKIGAEIGGLQRGLQEAQGKIAAFQKKASDLTKPFAGLTMAAGIAGVAVAAGLGLAAKAGMDFDSKMQQAQISFETMLGSAEKANVLLGKLQKMAAETPFEFPDLQDAAKRMLAFGFSAEQIIPMLKAVGDASAGLGLSGAEGLGRIGLALGQMKAKAKVSADEMLQLTEVGVPAWDILAKAMGKSTAEVMKLSEKGLIPADKAIQILIKGMEERFPNMMQKQSQSFAGLMSTLKDNLNMTFGAVMKPVFDWLTANVLPKAIELTNKFTDTLKKAGMVPALKTIIPAPVVDALVKFGEVVKAVFGFLERHSGVVKVALIGLTAALAALAVQLTVVKTVMLGMSVVSALTNPLGMVAAAVGLVAMAAYEIYKHWGGIKAWFTGLWTSIKKAVVNAANSVVAFLKKWGSLVLAVLTGPFGMAVLLMTKYGRNIVEGIWKGISGAVGWLKDKVTRWIHSLVSHIKALLKISSPSGIMAEVGRNISEGLAAGVQEKIGAFASALESGINAAVARAKAAAANIRTVEAEIKAAEDRLAAMQEEQQRREDAARALSLRNELASLAERKKLTEARIAELNKRLAALQKHHKDTSAVRRQIAAAEHNLAEIKRQVTEKKIALEELETNQAIANAKKRLDALRQEQEAAERKKEIFEEERDLVARAKEVWQKYYDDLAAAREDYESKVREVNERLIADERRLWDEYNRAVAEKARSLAGFVGLFEAPETRTVSGVGLLENLRKQVDVFAEWQAEISALAAKGVDEGLIAQLREMGPKALPEIKALNTLTAAQLNEYVALWRQKNEMARSEAQVQLEQMRVETINKIAELRAQAAAQLEAYRAEWEKKNAEIRKNTEEEVKRIHKQYQDLVDKATGYGVSLMTNFIGGIWSKFDDLIATLEAMAEAVDAFMPHSPARRGPLSRLAEYGPALVRTFAEGIRGSLPLLERAADAMAGVFAPGGLVPAGAVSYATTTTTTINTFNITISGGSTSDQADQLLRELARRGVRL